MERQAVIDLVARSRVPLGFVAAVLYFFWARPTVRSLLTGAIVAFVGLAWRAWASGTVRKDASLAVAGPYAFSRNPLYFGSFMIAAGFGWASRNAIVFTAVILFFVVIYWPVMRQEERHLHNLFGPAFEHYAARVPLFIPWRRRSSASGEPGRFSWGQYWRNREYNAFLGFGAAVGLLFFIKYLRGT